MVSILKISDVIRPIGIGVTNPYIIELDNKKKYVAKFPGNPEGDRALINEYVCAELAKIFELPIPNYELVTINDIESFEQKLPNIKMVNGTVFCSERMESVEPVLDYYVLTRVKNKEAVLKTLIFDIIIGNDDRNPGNFLVNFKNQSFVIIDHSHVFNKGVLWNAKSLEELIDTKIDVSKMKKRSFEISIQMLNIINYEKVIEKYKEKIRSIKEENIINIIENIPQDWTISAEEKKNLIDFLMNRISRIDEICNLILNGRSE